MAQASVLSRYLDPDILSHVAERKIEPQGLVEGNLAGAHKSPLHGFAVEFAGHREYVPGDDPKHIDWRVYFTRDKYFIKQYEMETNFVCHLVLDVSASMRFGEEREQKLQYAAQLAATLAYSIAKQSDKVSLTTFDEEIIGHIRPSNSVSQVIRMTQHLDEIDPVQKTNMAGCLHELNGRTKSREIVMIFSDFLTDIDELEAPLQRMRYDQHEVVLFQVMHHDELEFDMEGMVKFVGLETTDEVVTQPDELRRNYLKALEAHQEKIRELCLRNRIEYVLCDTSQNMATALLDYLHQRGLMRRQRAARA
ncbi:MAG: DUF58 domain-containing protein [Pirellulales bacterium]|nr:DUF58 domain-containing protein [Pirellulales bacterium]